MLSAPIIEAEVRALHLRPLPPPLWPGGVLSSEGEVPGGAGADADPGPGSPQGLVPVPKPV